MFKKIIFIGSIFFNTSAFAWFCPNNFNLIQAGDPIDKVLAQCGKPLSQTTSKEEPKVPQEWNYYVSLPLTSANTSSVKMSVVFDASGIVQNITVNSLSSPSTGLCGGTIAIGSTMDAVKAACGAPPFINKGQTPQGGNADQKIKVDSLVYGGTAPNTLVFENGVLVGRR